MKSMLVLCAVAGLAGACASDPSKGYSFKDTYDSQSRTIQVPIFQNKTPWIIDPSPAADTTLSGTIVNVQMRKTATDPSGYVQELGYIITVDFEWVDNSTGKTLVSRRNFSGADTFVPTRGVSEKIEYGQSSAVQRTAKDIVSELRTNW